MKVRDVRRSIPRGTRELDWRRLDCRVEWSQPPEGPEPAQGLNSAQPDVQQPGFLVSEMCQTRLVKSWGIGMVRTLVITDA